MSMRSTAGINDASTNSLPVGWVSLIGDAVKVLNIAAGVRSRPSGYARVLKAALALPGLMRAEN